jgi:hypothetical protein
MVPTAVAAVCDIGHQADMQKSVSVVDKQHSSYGGAALMLFDIGKKGACEPK